MSISSFFFDGSQLKENYAEDATDPTNLLEILARWIPKAEIRNGPYQEKLTELSCTNF